MPRRRPEAPPINATEKRLMEALARLKEGKPTDPALQKAAALERLQISFSAVAQEAGLSRTLIGHEGCRYPRARAAVMEAMKPVAQPRTAAEVINNKREQVALLEEAIRVGDSAYAAVVVRMSQIESEAERRIQLAIRRAANAPADANKVAGRRLAAPADSQPDGAVVPLWPKSRAGKTGDNHGDE